MCVWCNVIYGIVVELFVDYFQFFIKVGCVDCDIC